MKKYRVEIITLAVLLIAFTIIAVLSLSGAWSSFERSVYNQIAKLISPSTTSIFKAITYLGSFWFLVGIVILLLIIPYTRKKFGFPVAIILVANAFVNFVLKLLFRRERPNILWLVSESGFAFPSGHTQSCTALFIAIALIILLNYKTSWRYVCVAVCIIIPVLVALSRIYLGVHYLGDVLAGLAIGASVAIFINIIWQILNRRLENNKLHKYLF